MVNPPSTPPVQYKDATATKNNANPVISLDCKGNQSSFTDTINT